MTREQEISMDRHLRNLLPQLEHEWGTRPRCALADHLGEDEHWLVYNPMDQGLAAAPRWMVDANGAEEIL